MSDGKSFLPFPQIPRYPGEAARGKTKPAEPEEPPLEGPPQTAEESIFSRPGIVEALSLLEQYTSASAGRQRNIIQGEVRQAAIEPGRLTRICDSLELIAQMVEDQVTDGRLENVDRSNFREALNLASEIRDNIDKVRLRTLPSAEACGKWVRLLTEEGEYARDAERVLTELFARANSPKAVTDVMYNIADGALFDSNSQVAERALRILIGDTEIMGGMSEQYINSLLAEYDLSDDVLKKIFEVGAAIDGVVRHRFPDIMPRRTEIITEAVSDPNLSGIFGEKLRAIRDKDTQRFYDLRVHHTITGESEDGVMHVGGADSRYPEFLREMALLAGPVRQKLNELLEDYVEPVSGQIVFNTVLPGVEGIQGYGSQAEVNQYILTKLRQPNSDGEQFTDLRHWRTLVRLLPEQYEAQWAPLLAQVNKRMIDDMHDNSNYLLSPRGDLVEVTNPHMQALGFESVLYEMDPRNRRDTLVTMRIGNFDYRILLDENFALYDARTMRPMILPPCGEFVISVILSHLREIRCNSSVAETGSTGSAGRGRSSRRTVVRRPHRRRLPIGHRPTPGQIARALNEYDINLVRMNRDLHASQHAALARGEQVDERMVTYVFPEQEVAVGERGPVRSRAPEAGQHLDELLETE